MRNVYCVFRSVNSPACNSLVTIFLHKEDAEKYCKLGNEGLRLIEGDDSAPFFCEEMELRLSFFEEKSL